MKKRSLKKRAFAVVMVLLIMAVSVYIWQSISESRCSSARADAVLKAMSEVVPGLEQGGTASGAAAGTEIKAMSIEGLNVIGCLEIPSLDIRVPVTLEDEQESGFANFVSGSPGAGEFKINGSRSGVFSDISDLKPGDSAAFIDMDGIRYEYRVVTQYHLRAWDEGDNDMMLCYRTDDTTAFVVGFSKG